MMKSSKLESLLQKTDGIAQQVRELMAASTAAPSSGSCRSGSHPSAATFTGRLRDYQLGGVEWLLSLHRAGFNGILADEMGLGKTVQVIAFLCSLLERSAISGPHIIVAPLSVIASWKKDMARFCPAGSVSLHVHRGEREQRMQALQQWLSSTRAAAARFPARMCVLLTTHDLLARDLHLLREGPGARGWAYLVVDEAHRLKNRLSVLHGALLQVRHRRCVLLTGTPLQNNLQELWSLLAFILPKLFNDLVQFSDWFSRPFDYDSDGDSRCDGHSTPGVAGSSDGQSAAAALHRAIKPFLLRRTKKDVLAELPSRVERTVLCPLSALQREVLRLVRSRAERLAAPHSKRADGLGADEGVALSFQNIVMQLRKLCNHPFLVLEDLKSIPDALYFEQLLSSSGKLAVLDVLLRRLLPQGHKVLIFSQMTSTLDILQGYLHLFLGVQCSRLDGGVKGEERERQIDAFGSTAPAVEGRAAPCVFLISTRAGGVGINLQAADTIILFDSDWNPQADLQAIGRAHRMGQESTVLVLRLVSLGESSSSPSVEQRMLRRAQHKLCSERIVLRDGLFDMGTTGSRRSEAAGGYGGRDDNSNDDASGDCDQGASGATSKDSSGGSSPLQSPADALDWELYLGPRSTPGRDGSIYSALFQEVRAGDGFEHVEGEEERACSDASTSSFLVSRVCDRGSAGSSIVNFSASDDISRTINSADSTRWKEWLEAAPASAAGAEDGGRLRKRAGGPVVYCEITDSGRARFEMRRPGVKRSAAAEQQEEKLPRNKRGGRGGGSLASSRGALRGTAVAAAVAAIEAAGDGVPDECVLCGQKWVFAQPLESPAALSRYSSRIDGGAAFAPIFSDSDVGLLERLQREDSENMMIICDGCDGPYHLLCIGLQRVPEDEWFCRFCVQATATIPPYSVSVS